MLRPVAPYRAGHGESPCGAHARCGLSRMRERRGRGDGVTWGGSASAGALGTHERG
ncbi:epstein-Barr virus [Burkholderia pseudomallei]|nr:epstein-Barr virus [Burkholderia pseudomallei]EBA48703.1 epstein-Barr virus [Burkholderia pseudomallei 305]ARK54511.1 epstein-Barr virus [Burkholderia pseudomallei]ARK66207.1 epstein-Barr virus [Burkholderia pseudomallei]ARK75538.1 epstein-Barr virus [Burkholderia pseudomallei]